MVQNFLTSTTVKDMVAAFQAKTAVTGYSGLAFPEDPYATDAKKKNLDPGATLQELFLEPGSLNYTLPDAMPTLYVKGYKRTYEQRHKRAHEKTVIM